MLCAKFGRYPLEIDPVVLQKKLPIFTIFYYFPLHCRDPYKRLLVLLCTKGGEKWFWRRTSKYRQTDRRTDRQTGKWTTTASARQQNKIYYSVGKPLWELTQLNSPLMITQLLQAKNHVYQRTTNSTFKFCSNEGPHPFPRGNNYKIAKIH